MSCILFLVTPKDSIQNNDVSDKGSIAVLVPAYNEGEALIDSLKTLLSQDYLGMINVYLLIKDTNDTSYSFVELFLKSLPHVDNRNIQVCLTGEQGKKEKINKVLPTLNEDFIAFLDADHRADNQWLSSSVYLSESEGHDVVQSVRRPLAISSFFQVWDSLQNHIGNEVFNSLYRKLKLTTFFTGTTCVFKSSALKDHIFPSSLTEDTFLSYQLIIAGKKIGYNPYFGSYEEVAPDLSSYIARRRRWSNGHNQTFFYHFKKILKLGNNRTKKMQLLLHGGYYFLPVLIVVLTNIVGGYFFLQYTDNVQVLCLGLTLFLSLSFGLLRFSSIRDLIYETIVGFIVILPYISLGSVYIYRFSQHEIYYQIISFPFREALFWINLVMVSAPMLVLIAGRRLYKHPSLGVFFSHLVFYPFVLVVDVFSGTLGFLDLVLNNKKWGKVKRNNVVDSSIVPKSISDHTNIKKLRVRKFYAIVLAPITVLFVLLANDFLVFHNCGEPKYFFSNYIFFDLAPPFRSSLFIRLSSAEEGKYLLKITNEVEGEIKHSERSLKLQVNGKTIYKGDLSDKTTYVEHTGEMGWGTEVVTSEVEVNGFSCVQKREFSNSIKELRQGQLYVNGEPFLIKCIIPSFSNSKVNLSVADGLGQIKKAGANCIRVYHSPTEDLMDEARRNQLLVISQPDETTWANLKMSKSSNIKELMHRYEEHVGLTGGNPYMFFEHLGNELEIHNDDGKSIHNIFKALDNIRKEPYYRYPISYSTYNTFIKYPVDILGINMLDSGDVYWKDGLNHIKSLNIPFYASEFGGFVAFYEQTPTFLRIHRLYENWQNLLDHGSLGAAFFQSHDNWAQPVPVGYNDPFDNEMPDDLRGFWDIDNKPKPELNHLSTILSDLGFKYLGNRKLEFSNRRNYLLQDVHLIINGVTLDVGELVPGQSSVFDLKDESRFLNIKASYLTHRGLKNENEFIFDTNSGMKPRLLTTSKLPDVSQLMNGSHWGDFLENNVHGGLVVLRLTLPENLSDHSFLSLDGLGAQKIQFVNMNGDKRVVVNVHNYREQIFRVIDLKNDLGDVREIILEIDRDQVGYLAESDGRRIPITLKKPVIYNPTAPD
jgi:cellulose synthase/poly-beta-1,6-N-acetylglucosamine synthase-like glycosyltransferase